MTFIKECTCKSEFQDQRYGKGMRVHNEGKGGVGFDDFRCTVCGKVKIVNKRKKEEK